MNHQPFETWIISGGPIQSEEQEKLSKHLLSCEDCQRLSMAMEGIKKTFRNAPSPEPAPGFSMRWQARLEVHRQQRQQQRMWILTLAIFGLASLLSLTIVLIEFGQINWFYEISKFIAHFSLFAARANQIWVVMQSINKALPVILPIMIVFGVGSISAMIALIVTWFSSMVQLYQPVE